VLLSLALGYWMNPNWYFFTAFVGLNLVQSAFTNWCPMMTFLRKLERRPWSGPLAGNAGVRAGVEPDGGTNAAMAG